MNLRLIAYSCAAILAASTCAKAADVINGPEPIYVPAFSWGGAYIGGQVGYGWGKSSFDDGYDGYNGYRRSDDPSSLSPSGFIGGIYAGYNFDIGSNVILGIDGDINYANQKGSFDFDDGLNSASVTSELQWSGSVRGRMGYAAGRFMPYLAGGVAFGQVKNSIRLNDDRWDSSRTLTGWTIGGGVDYAATDNIVLRLEYRYTDFGRRDFSFDDLSSSNRFRSNDIRLGVAYKF
ncbi:MAG: porin family protein [Rhizobiales bacterium]|nr:porin family protein [Hyphomicrobiales bacterium]OJY06772.1 MAG: autotransporter outer membrane beta-barrel domain-containing protein [Rhizobiales bacterium 63-22]